MKKSNCTTVKIINIEIGDNCDAWYYCSDGHTYYDCMFTCDTFVGKTINPDNYMKC